MDDFEMVLEFHRKFDLMPPVSQEITKLRTDLLEFRVQFLHEENDEIKEGIDKDDLPLVSDGLVDLLYVADGTMVMMNMKTPPPPTWGQVAFVTTYLNHRLERTPGFSRHPKEFNRRAELHINDFHYYHMVGQMTSALIALNNIRFLCYEQAQLMNLPFHDLFADVHRANMAKERATEATASARGGQWDVIKPAGWEPPTTKAILMNAGWRP